ncbi:MAG: hypothetical protein KC656_10980, partial [Myxococcales bacterium]|nr:hypothetical protein [Myxococcales bacterium]
MTLRQGALFARFVAPGRQALVLQGETAEERLTLDLPYDAEAHHDVAFLPAGDLFAALGLPHRTSWATQVHGGPTDTTTCRVEVELPTNPNRRPRWVRFALELPSPRSDALFLPLSAFAGPVDAWIQGVQPPGWTSRPVERDRDGWLGTGPVHHRRLEGPDVWQTLRESCLPVLLDWFVEQGWHPSEPDTDRLNRARDLGVPAELVALYEAAGRPPRGLYPTRAVEPLPLSELLWIGYRRPRTFDFAKGPGEQWTIDEGGRVIRHVWGRTGPGLDLEGLLERQLHDVLAGRWCWAGVPGGLDP